MPVYSFMCSKRVLFNYLNLGGPGFHGGLGGPGGPGFHGGLGGPGGPGFHGGLGGPGYHGGPGFHGG